MSAIKAGDLARELNTTVPLVLQVADDVIGRVVEAEGLDGARGLSTYPGPGGTATLTAELADLVRTSVRNAAMRPGRKP